MNPWDVAKEIIESGTYLSLATTDGNEPWVNAVFYAHDKNFNLYFASYNDSIHVQNIINNPSAAVAIFDSHIVPGQHKGQGVQIRANCYRVIGKELEEAIEVLYSKRFPNPEEYASRDLSVEHFSQPDSGDRTDHIYKITPQKIYILDKTPGVKDTRVEVVMHTDNS